MKIAVYAISKNEEKFVERFCESAKDADVILIADTGSTDSTVEKAKKCGAIVHNITISPWRFDAARQTALALLPADVDVCISLDLDETLNPGWREEIEKHWTGDTNRLQHMFDNNDELVFAVSRVHARHGFSWKYPCHEYVIADPRTTEHLAVSTQILMTHNPDRDKSRGQYLPMLEMAIKENPTCARSQFYYARELLYYQRWQDCIDAFKKYLEMDGAFWHVERSYAYRVIGSCEEMLGNDGTKWFYMSLGEDPHAREPWMELSLKHYKKLEWPLCYINAKRALEQKDRYAWHTTDPKSWGWAPYDMVAVAAYHLGLKEEAISNGEIALQFEPTNERLIQNLDFYRK
jgi:glycosyltransferase involved in cell wall biosynthesis